MPQHLLVLLLLPALTLQCPSPFSLRSGRCLFVNASANSTWCSANERCSAIGGELVNAYDSVRLLVNGSSPSASCDCDLWIGLSDLVNERNTSSDGWQRVNERGLFPTDDSLFALNRSTEGRENKNCMKIVAAGGRLRDVNCNNLLGFACEFVGLTKPMTAVAATAAAATSWTAVIVKQEQFDYDSCHVDFADVRSEADCALAALRAGSGGHLLYHSGLRACRLLQFTGLRPQLTTSGTDADWLLLDLIS